jgi:hypothetical protein
MSILKTIIAAVLLTALLAAPAQAHTHHLNTAHVGARVCEARGTSAYYVHLGDPIDPNVILNSPYVFRHFKCEVNNFRLFKSAQNTRGEANFVRKFLKEDTATSTAPVVYCRTDETHSYLLDLAINWGLFGVKHRNADEKRYYVTYAHRYAHRHDCHLFLPQHP